MRVKYKNEHTRDPVALVDISEIPVFRNKTIL